MNIVRAVGKLCSKSVGEIQIIARLWGLAGFFRHFCCIISRQYTDDDGDDELEREREREREKERKREIKRDQVSSFHKTALPQETTKDPTVWVWRGYCRGLEIRGYGGLEVNP